MARTGELERARKEGEGKKASDEIGGAATKAMKGGARKVVKAG